MPALHVVHTRSFDAEAAVTWAWPAWQTVCGWHAPPAVENVPDAHDLQERSVVVVGAANSSCPAGHVLTGTHC